MANTIELVDEQTSQSLDEFMAEIKSDVVKFEAAYRAKAMANPEHYPLTLQANNKGLWFEFFMTFCTDGSV